MIPLGLAGGGAVFELARRRGRNEVYAGGAADAAFGPTGTRPGSPLPPPGSAPEAPAPTRLVADSEMAGLATIEFVPPTGIAPWQGNVLLREKIDDDTVSAWFSGPGRPRRHHDQQGRRRRQDGRRRARARSTPPPTRATRRSWPSCSPATTPSSSTATTRTSPTAWRSARAQIEQHDRHVGLLEAAAAERVRQRVQPARMSVPLLIFGAVWLFIVGGSLLSAAARRLQRPDRGDHLRHRRAGRRRLRGVPLDAPGAQRRAARRWRCAPSRSAASSPPARAATSSGRGSRACCGSTRRGPWPSAPPTRGSGRWRRRASRPPS